MDVQQALLSKVINDSAISLAVNARITPEFFTDDKWRGVYEYCLDRWRRYGTPPDADVVRGAFPSYEFPLFAQPIEYFIDELRQRRKRVILTNALAACGPYLQATDDPDALDDMEAMLRDGLTQVRLETSPSLDVSVPDRIDDLMARIDDRSESPGYLRGISTGISGIDYVTGGLQPEQFIVVIGLPKSMKSSMLLYIAKRMHTDLKLPLFIGFEMSNEEQEDRLLSMYGNVSLTKIMSGRLDFRERNRIEAAMKMMANASSTAFILSADVDSAMTVSGVHAKVMEYQPDAVLIDGAYLMHSELPKIEQGSPQALANIARELKKLAQTQHIPVVVSTQASESRSRGGKLTAASAMYTQAWRQSADVLIGTERVYPEGDDTGNVPIRYKVLASRSGPRAETVLLWNWSHGTVKEPEDPSEYTKDSDGGAD